MPAWLPVVLAVVFGLGWSWEGAEHDRQARELERANELAARYAAAIAACANGGAFRIGEQHVVSCKTKTVPSVY